MKRIHISLVISVLLLSACADELAEVCGRSPGTGGSQCCAVGTLDIENNFQARNFSCEASNTQCKDTAVTSAYPAHKFPFIPSANYKGNTGFEGGCAPVKWEKKGSLLSSFANVDVEQLLSESGVFVPINEPLNCLERCNYDFPNGGGGNPALCPSINIEPGVASALFFFYSDVDPSKYPNAENIVSIRDILAKFSVPDEDLAACPREDVTVYSDGRVINEGDACPAYSSFSVQGQDIESQFGISERLFGNFASQNKNDALMTYPNMTETFDLAHDRPAYNALYGGKIRKSGRLYDSAIAEILNRQNLKTCVRADSQFNLSKEEEFLLRDATGEEISLLINSVLEALEPNLKISGSPTPAQKFRPVFSALEALSDNQFRELSASITSVTLSSKDVEQKSLIVPLARWMDASICNSALFVDDEIQFEYADGYRAELLLDEDVEIRELSSREFLRCVSVDGFVSDTFSAAVAGIEGEQE